jgi:hypothetical protein
MKTSHKITKIENRKDKHAYEGKFKDFQTFGSSFKGKPVYSQCEQDPYSEYQNFLYKRAMFGMKMYTPEEIKTMHPQKRERVAKVHKRAQHELNVWKQEKVIAFTNKIMSVFTRSSIAKDMVNLYSKPDPTFVSKMSFKDLGVSKEDVITHLLKKKILPNDFKTAK